MDHWEQNQVVMREDMTVVKAQMGQRVKAIRALARGQKEMRQANLRVVAANPAVMTIPVNPPGGDGTLVVTQPPPERVPVYQNAAQTFDIPINGRTQPEIDDHQDAFFTTRDDSVYDAFGSSLANFKRRFRMMEDKLKAIEGPDTFGLDATYMCLVQGVKIPPKFKVPNFEKYQGITCPKTHIRAFCRKMVAYSDDEKLLMHYFQDSLSGAFLEWYMQLERTQI
ncbi:uncharacterized protein LOC127130005 [Lathyrus oleraceus]|uniref:uncharacterized protein LOC127130005 n=1 Tax=Pisum sativum TaxID=3888 RepID=UPI0021D1936C|nr:uncharacterized protein LOC127130005 [Pisum sativum]